MSDVREKENKLTEFKVYWTDKNKSVNAKSFVALNEALSYTQHLRSEYNSFITLVSEITDNVGLSGVDSVTDGKLPDGTEYTWKKRRI